MLITGIIIRMATNLLIFSLSQAHSQPFNALDVIKNMAELILAFGVPVMVIAGKYYESEDPCRILKAL